ncbi:ubiquitin-like autophagy protein Apg12-domain-containing protein [Zychaea mexicana]|uniref:ubiquitin-like autophagy protein Apg12-domain-containing protein n=1 Tax=Zychaea mexicana TaxID=64656 RepID=UPI0022FE67DC|nr:ubiquitin-like autophagy protein Apg12-domain-containing protein [Zychaea mexicana]KAI9495741.1 ubiquitin-like autophagy protein Apg12-domain-containing protein [Zychaea mexicana]
MDSGETSQSDIATSSATDPANTTTAESESLQKSFEQVLESRKLKDATKVLVLFNAIGNAPILKQKLYKITASNKFQMVIQFLRKQLRYQGSDPLFLYINSAFAPAPDEIVGSLYKSFKTEEQLIVNYSTMAAWG